MDIKGKAWKLGDDINTDMILPARYLRFNDPADLAPHCMEGIRPGLAVEMAKGDIVVGGANFGCGSSREQAPVAMKGAGISCVIAKSFARIFYRNCINIGLPILECEEAVEQIEGGDIVRVDLTTGMITDESKCRRFQARPLPEFVRNIVAAGGLIEYMRERFRHV